MVHTANHEWADASRPIPEQGWEAKPVTIGPDCWIGMGVAIVPGVTIGEGCVVGAGSVVTRDLEDYCIAAGVPAKPLKSRR
jgi:acetyltransferase-like isoleucine patch superfamily enzyme